MEKTVVVLGAGASCEAHFPDGVGLVGKIQTVLTANPEDMQETPLEVAWAHACRLDPGLDQNGMYDAANQISKGLSYAPSIDNYIDSHRDNKNIAACAKLAIVLAICRAETESALNFGNNGKVNLENVAGSWYHAFARLLFTRCELSHLRDRLSRVAFVIFNYDRSFEHHLRHAIDEYYTCGLDVAAQIVSAIEIYHPYGRVGRLPWELSGTLLWLQDEGIRHKFGAVPNAEIVAKLAQQIKTFTEELQTEAEETVAIRRLVANPGRLLFLGYQFHSQNQDLLFGNTGADANYSTEVFGTVYNMSAPAQQQVKKRLRSQARFDNDNVHLGNRKCGEFIVEYERQLGFA
jgi:hypothetical protein